MSRNKGFTLIELLVVIAIIGILASVVLASLNTARGKARAASAKASLSSMRAQAELGVSNAGTYLNNICGATTGTGEIGTLLTAATNQGASNTCYDNDTDDATATVVPSEWAVESTMPSSLGFFCVDSKGNAKDYAADPTVTSAGCP